MNDEASDSESSSDEQIVDNTNIDENSTQSKKRKTVTKSPKHSSISTKQSTKQSQTSTTSDKNIIVSKDTVLKSSKDEVVSLSKEPQPIKLYSFQFLVQDDYEHCHFINVVNLLQYIGDNYSVNKL